MSIFKAFFSLGKIPKVVKYFEFGSFDEVNKMGGYLNALKNEARITGKKFSPAQKKYIEDQFRQVKLVFEQIEKYGKQEKAIKKTIPAKVFDLKGKEIDPDKPIMGGTQKSEAAIKTKLEASNKESAGRIRINKIKKEISDLETQIDEAQELGTSEEKLSDLITKRNDKEIELEFYEMSEFPEDFAGGGIAGMLGERVGFAGGGNGNGEDDGITGITMSIEERMERIRKLLKQMQDIQKGKGIDPDPEDFAYGGVAGMLGERQNFAMGRRAFMKLLGGAAAGIGALKTGILGFGKGASKQVAKDLTQVPIQNAEGMPSWFKPLVNRVIKEGTETTNLSPNKGGAYLDRQIVHSAKLGEGQGVRVYQTLDDQTIRVEYQSADNMGGVDGIVHLEYTAPQVIEPPIIQGGKLSGYGKGVKTKAEFSASEAYPYQDPKDYKYITFEGDNTVRNVDNLYSDTSALKQFGTNKTLSKKELEIAKQKQKRVKKINEDPGGEELAPLYDPDPYASGGIARMLGE